ncbi:ImmA/IrrE family metallo-endopeptidase [Herbidospora sp. NEAU-GS84]|uniref:ImmA/IrrE family metallo-endopeptidase n=1 Tax=Herbidospora solisilvae TaxID=2696284 RepID=A0A7C9NZU8_9ACTN|nr:XRE family transcriptional regulator [Herbidospora solisilvae]NAS22257.1 ImmA/IrrE family metallo-endopeptidase [Herbidospora solisilvae]
MPDPTTTRIHQLISARGQTQRQFAAEVGIDETKFSKSMSGVRRFTSLELARIAERGEVTVDWLLGVDRPLPATAARTRDAVDSEQAAIAEATRLSRFWADLEFLGYRQPRADLKARPPGGHPGGQGRALAATAIQMAVAAGHRPWETCDLTGLVETVFGIDVRVMRFETRYEGLSWRDETCSLMVVGTSEVPARQRFTIAHELGHLLASDDQGLHSDANLNDGDHTKQDTEVRANAFATEFLMPAKVLTERARNLEWSERAFAMLSCDLCVSPVALAWRLLNLRLITEEQCTGFRSITGLAAAELAGRLDEHVRLISRSEQPRIPLQLLKTSYRAYQEGQATIRPLANLLAIDPGQLKAIMDGAREDIPLSS